MSKHRRRFIYNGFAPAIVALLLAVAASSLAPLGALVPTTLLDFRQPGSQPNTLTHDLIDAVSCSGCHGFYDIEDEPYRRWAASMMAQAARDPIFFAALAIAEQDAGSSGDLCLRCHTPNGWLGGRSVPTDGSALEGGLGDFDGVSCNFCHRLVDPVFETGASPAEDQGILSALALPPVEEVHSGQYVVDPEDRRRGPYDLGALPWHLWLESPFHRESLLCATCHDVSNPAFEKQPDGSYALGNLNAPHTTQNKNDEFPIERTYSEWANSVFALAELDMGGRFGGNKIEVASCQDCHMPDTSGSGAAPGLGAVNREDLPQHDFNGANSWVLRAIDQIYPQFETGLEDQTIDDSIARNVSMLERAADLQTFVRGSELVARVVNMTGHKLPSGYPEGRRAWLHVVFEDAGGNTLAEHGAYDLANAVLDTTSTRVYEIEHALGADVASATGLPAGPSFHFVLNNEIHKDNRIPPRGFNAVAFEAAGAPIVAHTYPDEHYWDDATFAIPPGATNVTVELFHQTTSREFIEFLRDENTTNGAGQLAYDLWVMFGKSAPVLMQSSALDLANQSCAEPVPYGLGGLNGAGKRARMSWSGTPSFAANNFAITLTDAPANKFGASFHGSAARNIPFFSGNLLVTMPVRGPYFVTDANGEASVPIPITAPMIGTTRFYQMLFRDQGVSPPVGLSDALFVEFCD